MSNHHRYEVLAIEDHAGIRCADCWNENPEGLDSITHIYTPAESPVSELLFCDRCGRLIQ